MSTLPSDTFLGKLEMLDVYEYYDQPVLFACRNAAQTIYLVVQIDARQSVSVWLYAALSDERYHAVREGRVDLHSAFKAAEDEIVYEVTQFNTSHPAQIRVLPVNALHTAQLPAKGETLNIAPTDNQRTALGD